MAKKKSSKKPAKAHGAQKTITIVISEPYSQQDKAVLEGIAKMLKGLGYDMSKLKFISPKKLTETSVADITAGCRAASSS